MRLISNFVDIRAQSKKEERDEKAVKGPLEPRRDIFESLDDVESVHIKIDLRKQSSLKKPRNKIMGVPSLMLNDMAIVDVTS